MTHVRRLDHVGLTVSDLAAATAFFVSLGLEVEGTGSVAGEFVETVCAIPGARCEIAMLRLPDGGCRLELSSFVHPDHVPGSPEALANELGLRNVSFEVADLDAALGRLEADGYGLVGGVGEYEGSVRMAYVRGPDGIVVSLFEQLVSPTM
jgi:catechol 2,3-dioxygenase-like lactoylglutathione lyase family enzyme